MKKKNKEKKILGVTILLAVLLILSTPRNQHVQAALVNCETDPTNSTCSNTNNNTSSPNAFGYALSSGPFFRLYGDDTSFFGSLVSSPDPLGMMVSNQVTYCKYMYGLISGGGSNTWQYTTNYADGTSYPYRKLTRIPNPNFESAVYHVECYKARTFLPDIDVVVEFPFVVAPIASISTDKSSVSGESYAITWGSTSNAKYCERNSDKNSAWTSVPTSGSEIVTSQSLNYPAANNPTTFNINCYEKNPHLSDNTDGWYQTGYPGGGVGSGSVTVSRGGVTDPPAPCDPPVSTQISCPAGYTGTYTATTSYGPPNDCPATTTDNKSTACVPIPTDTSPITVSIHANPSGSLVAPGSTTLDWTTTGNPTSCTASDYWSGSKSPSGGSELRSGMTASPTPYHYVITCYKGGASATDSTSVTVVASQYGPATIAVLSNVATSWTINPGNFNAVGTSGSHQVSPEAGTYYTLAAPLLQGYNAPTITNKKNATPTVSSNTMKVYSGEADSYTINYTPSECTTPETRHVACDMPVISGDVTQARSVSGEPACTTYGTWTYQTDNCVPVVYCEPAHTPAPNNQTSNCTTGPSATINVSSNSSASWTITPGNLVGSGNGSKIVTPGSGTPYTITPANVQGMSYTVTNNRSQTGSSATLFNGDAVTFTINYTNSVVSGPFTYSLSNSGPKTIDRNVSSFVQNNVTKTLTGGTAGPVTLTISNVPSGVSVAPSSDGCTPSCISTFTFTASPSASVGTSLITITGSPNNQSTSFNLTITGTPMSVTCVPTPAVIKVGESVSWAANVSGGTAPYTYSWSGNGIPTPAPSGAPYVVRYSTIGIKNTTVSVSDSSPTPQTASCLNSTVQVQFNPKIKEF